MQDIHDNACVLDAVWSDEGLLVLVDMANINCPSMEVPMAIMEHVVHVESSGNPFAIGVVGGRLVRQPENMDEAIATAKMLKEKGYNFSLGLAQVNRYNLEKYGISSYRLAFSPCSNLEAGSKILAECYRRSEGDWGKSFSCYYSGNFVTGFKHGYVKKIYASISRDSTRSEPASIELVRSDKVRAQASSGQFRRDAERGISSLAVKRISAIAKQSVVDVAQHALSAPGLQKEAGDFVEDLSAIEPVDQGKENSSAEGAATNAYRGLDESGIVNNSSAQMDRPVMLQPSGVGVGGPDGGRVGNGGVRTSKSDAKDEAFVF